MLKVYFELNASKVIVDYKCLELIEKEDSYLIKTENNLERLAKDIWKLVLVGVEK